MMRLSLTIYNPFDCDRVHNNMKPRNINCKSQVKMIVYLCGPFVYVLLGATISTSLDFSHMIEQFVYILYLLLKLKRSRSQRHPYSQKPY